jgi:hypothetical protein
MTLQTSLVKPQSIIDSDLQNRKHHAEYMREWRLKHPDYVARTKDNFAKWKENHPDYWYEYNKQWTKAHPFSVLESHRRYCKKHPEYQKEHRKRYAERHPDRKSARHKAFSLNVESCARCGSTWKIERHHPDYSKPLNIVPLCHTCHVREHNGLEVSA